jgi:hypothetical protein
MATRIQVVMRFLFNGIVLLVNNTFPVHDEGMIPDAPYFAGQATMPNPKIIPPLMTYL